MTLTPQPSPLGRTTQFTAGLVASALLACAAPAAANGDGGGGSGGGPSIPGVTQTRVVEWDLPQQVDGRPGAIAVDHYGNQGGRLWFLTREGDPKVYQFEPPKSLKTEQAKWVSWTLNPAFLGPTGGIKKIKTSYDRRFVFVRTVLSVQRIDTISNERVTYPNNLEDPENPSGMSFVSDIAADNQHNVYVTERGLLRRLNASGKCVNRICPETTITTWNVDAIGNRSVGECFYAVDAPTSTAPCLSGVAVHPRYQHLVYFVDTEDNYIGELDTASKSCSCSTAMSKVRYWSLNALGTDDTPAPQGPRQLNIDQDGILWTVTSSGHLVSLNPKSNYMTSHAMPPRLSHDPFGVAPDGGRIGYTDIDAADLDPKHVVGMLSPKGRAVRVTPAPVWASKDTDTVIPECDDAIRTYGNAPAVARNVPTTITSKNDGTFIEAMIDENTDITQMRRSFFPLGITPDFDRAVGTFFYAVGENEGILLVNRIGVARLPHDHGHKGKHDRDDEDPDDDGRKRGDDDDDDDDGKKNDLDEDDDADGILDLVDDDDDNDGIKNEHDRKDSREAQSNHQNVVDPGQAEEYFLTVRPNSAFVAASAVAENPLTPVSIELVDAAGSVVATSPSTPGASVLTVPAPAAGEYLVRVKNNGLGASGIATSVLSREPWPIPSVGTVVQQLP
jgi:hypothetical protein